MSSCCTGDVASACARAGLQECRFPSAPSAGRLHPPDACLFELMRFRVRPPKARELPLQLKVVMRVSPRHVELRADVLVPGYHSRKHGQVPCEDVQIRFPIPECWVYLFRVEKHFRYGALKSAARRPGKIKVRPRPPLGRCGGFTMPTKHPREVWLTDKGPGRTRRFIGRMAQHMLNYTLATHASRPGLQGRNGSALHVRSGRRDRAAAPSPPPPLAQLIRHGGKEAGSWLSTSGGKAVHACRCVGGATGLAGRGRGLARIPSSFG